MREELEKKLVEKYPQLFRDYGEDMRVTCMAWGMPHGDGWYKILEELCEQIKDSGVIFSQIKEKFGMLTIYYHGTTTKSDQEVSDLIHEAESKSREVCERCGEPGKCISDHGWLTTLCKKCRVMREIERG
jgi:hypothetical protein